MPTPVELGVAEIIRRRQPELDGDTLDLVAAITATMFDYHRACFRCRLGDLHTAAEHEEFIDIAARYQGEAA